MKKKENACGEFKGWILPVLRFSFRGERIYFANLGFKSLVEVYFMVIGVRRGNVVCCLFQEY